MTPGSLRAVRFTGAAPEPYYLDALTLARIDLHVNGDFSICDCEAASSVAVLFAWGCSCLNRLRVATP